MGTSQSSTGPGAGVSLVPPWADEPEDADDPNAPDDGDGQSDGDGAGQQGADGDGGEGAGPVAGAGRFTSTRRNLRSFAKNGDTTGMRRAVRDYVTTGYGGSTTMGRRLSRTTSTADALNRALSGNAPELFDRAAFAGRDALGVMDAVVNALAPADGTQDAEASRDSIADALADLLDRYPTADLTDLTDAERAFVIEGYTASEVYHRFMLDVGKHLQDCAPDHLTAMNRAEQVRDYIRQVIAGAFHDHVDRGLDLNQPSIRAIVTSALDQSLVVFTEYTDGTTT